MTEEWPNFREVDWDDLYPRLLLATEARLRRVRWRGQYQSTAPMALLAGDFVQMAILKAMNGARRYDVNKSLFHNLCQIVSSEVSNLIQSYENRNFEHADHEKIVDIRDYRDTPEDDAAHRETIHQLLGYLEERDPPARLLAEQIILHGRVRSPELSVELKRTISDIENIKKRLRRLCIKYQQEYRQDSGPGEFTDAERASRRTF
jgi:DNA-directed RNA polymerase specialized sigma24 family protein